jgi:hypothetical protein
MRDGYVYLLSKRAPSKSIKTAPSPRARLGSQEPRRPRFSFFHLHNVKELTSGPENRGDVMEAMLPNSGEQDLVPVARRPVCPFRIAERWERLALGVVNEAGCIRDPRACQHPF